jgi:hypothetical protein
MKPISQIVRRLQQTSERSKIDSLKLRATVADARFGMTIKAEISRIPTALIEPTTAAEANPTSR